MAKGILRDELPAMQQFFLIGLHGKDVPPCSYEDKRGFCRQPIFTFWDGKFYCKKHEPREAKRAGWKGEKKKKKTATSAAASSQAADSST